ncbi:MAG: IPT/TIG domain-containing protein [Phycisphaerae bacterium]
MMRNVFKNCMLGLGMASACGVPLMLGGCPNPAETVETDDARARRIDVVIQPDMGPIEGGTLVTIVGEGFREGTSVQFGGHTALDVQIINERFITAVTPPGDTAGAATVTLLIPQDPATPTHVGVVALRADFSYYILPPDDGTDTDGDGLTDYAELVGWEVWTDQFGLTLGVDTFGNVTRYTCISDPTKADTDNDGLLDNNEFLARCDARSTDTDGDGLSDYEEIVRFRTSATHVDSDHDSRGPAGNNPPNVALLDGQEMITAGFITPKKPIISEYLEGPGNDRALEIYNPTDMPIDLGAESYRIWVRNPLTTAAIHLNGVVGARQTFVVADSLASKQIRARAQQVATLPFDGSHLVELVQGTSAVDAIGSAAFQYGEPSFDQQQPTGTLWFAAPIGQTATVGVSGRLSAIDVRVQCLSPAQGTILVYRNNELVMTQPVAYDAAPAGAPKRIALDANPLFAAGDTLAFTLTTSAGSLGVGYSSDNPYPGGSMVGVPQFDLNFSTVVAPLTPWGDPDHSARDHVLRRKLDRCMPVAHHDGGFDPAIGWDVYPTYVLENFGKHDAVCVPFRVVIGGTSPSLADTDGDNVSDWEEFDHPSRSPLVADLPEIAVDVVDNIDVRLLVEYADSNGQSSEYSTSFAEGKSTTTGSAHARSISNAVAVGIEIEAQFGTDSHQRIAGSFEYSHEWGDEWSTSSESTQESQKEFARAEATSRERQETVSKGEMAAGLAIRNTGNVAYDLSDIAIAVRQYVPDLLNRGPQNARAAKLRTIGTLRPDVESVTLASGESSPVLRFADDEVNPAFVREYLANPTGLFLEPAALAITNAEGLNYAFITQTTQSRTALVSIDYAGSEQPYEKYFVATNVDRNADGSLAGVPLRAVLERIVGLERDDAGDAGYALAPRDGSGPLELALVRGLGPQTVSGSRWFVMGEAQGLFEDFDNDGLNNLSFDDIVLHPGDAIRLVLARDDDADGLVNLEEAYHGTGTGVVDSDSDGLTDKRELNGWQITVAGEPRFVVSDPRVTDTDQDSLSDAQEEIIDTDPSNADTDADALADTVDPHPTVPASRLYVNAAIPVAGDGTSWSSAYQAIELAVAAAHARNGGDPADDVSEIWVARGTYLPTGFFYLPNYVGIYGGFIGTETTLSQRDADPFTNKTVISGNIGDPASHLDNLPVVIRALGTNETAILDGFTISDTYANTPAAALIISHGATLRNLLLLNNVNDSNPGGSAMIVIASGAPTFTNVSFVQNSSFGRGGAVHVMGRATMQRCRFIGNSCTSTDTLTGGGGLFVATGGNVALSDCLFDSNQAGDVQDGGGIYVDLGATTILDRCALRNNNYLLNMNFGVAQPEPEGGAVYSRGMLVARNCTFSGNRAYQGGAIKSGPQGRLELHHCSIGRNLTGSVNSPSSAAVDSHGIGDLVYNCVIAENTTYLDWLGGYVRTMEAQFHYVFPRYCLLPRNGGPTNVYTGMGNLFVEVNSDVFAPGSSMQLLAGSPAIDAGADFYDVDRLTPGIQFLDGVDVSGKPRVADGDGDGEALIDIGAHEFQAAP